MNSPSMSVEFDKLSLVVDIAALFWNTITSRPSFSDIAASKAYIMWRFWFR
jgi:hypothetical protein